MTRSEHIDEQARGWIVRLRDEDARAEDWLAFQAWLEESDDHRAAFDEAEALWLTLDELSAEEEFGPSSEVVLDLAAARARRTEMRSLRRRYLAPSMAAAAVMAIMVGVWSQSLRGDVYVSGDQPRTVLLEDGSRLDLNRHTRARVQVAGDRRLVFLSEGEAAFDVRHDASRPFVLRAGNDEVRVLGTAFNVVRHGGLLEVAVSRGRVAVETERGRTWTLAAGQVLTDRGQGAVDVATVDAGAVGSWRQGLLVYRDAPLQEVAEDVSRYLDKPVNVDSSVRGVRFTGVLRVGDEAAMLRQIEDFLPVRATPTQAQVRLSSRGQG